MMHPTHPLLDRLDAWMADFEAALRETRLWDVYSDEGKAPVAHYEPATGRRYPTSTALEAFLKKHSFLYLIDARGEWQATLQSATRLLWNHRASEYGKQYEVEDARGSLAEARWAGLSGWELPTKDELQSFTKASDNPHRGKLKFRLAAYGGEASPFWLTTDGCCNVDNGSWDIEASRIGYLFACHRCWRKADSWQILRNLGEWGFVLRSIHSKICFGVHMMPKDARSLLKYLHQRGEQLVDGMRKRSVGPHPALSALADLDWRPSRLPKLEVTQLSDPQQGLWELWGAPPELLKEWDLVARNPAQDLRSHPVAIDFGTSSTVVAIDDGQRAILLRVGARDFYAPEEPEHFENPTVLECLDFDAFFAEWRRTTYRPAHDWDWLRVGHEAQASWRDNPGDTKVLGAILTRMKQWALRGERAPNLRLFDRKSGKPIDIPPLSDRRPVRGQPLVVSPEDPFDPIEFYAFQLGMVINWRKRGIYTRYYLSFPVKFEKAVKERVLASFARGLQRSLPQTLVEQGRVLQEFIVEELASEPAAYAAAALRHLGLTPTDTGLPYAVFDFGGGTTDFDYGLWRWATPEEEASGYEEVFEHLASSGDNFLGGENLLENLAFRVFCANLDALRAPRIQFTKPLDAVAPPAAEAFIQPTQAAQTNMVMLMTRLRPFWESDDGQLESQLKLDLLNADGSRHCVELALDREALDGYLRERIAQGVRQFLEELKRAFDHVSIDAPIHVLLAGNASRSRHVRALFDPDGEHWPKLLKEVFGDAAPPLEVHLPPPLDRGNPHAPTAKTGVALGLLRLAPGRKVKIIDCVRARDLDEAPFRFFVGGLRRGVFQPVLKPETRYYEWHEVGPIAQGVFDLRYTLSVRARQKMPEGDPELYCKPLLWPEARDRDRLWVRAIAPNAIEACCLPPGEQPTDDTPATKIELHVGSDR